MLNLFFGRLLHPFRVLLFPQLCSACSQTLVQGEHFVCLECLETLPQTRFHLQQNNLVENRLRGRIPLYRATSFYFFQKDGRLQELLHNIKYRQGQRLAEYMGELFGRSLKSVSWVQHISVLIPVPLSEKKRLLRGYNQSEHLAIGLGRVLNLRVDTTSLIRSRDTETQTRKTKEQRLDNVADAFQCNPSALYSGIHIGLVDDVFTTGATVEACALAFKSIHAQISILTLAYAIES